MIIPIVILIVLFGRILLELVWRDFSKDLDVKELKRRKKELIEHPERGTKLKDL